jgi:LAO/AO transport system kinase
MLAGSTDDCVFIRSLASREEMGGVSAEVWPMSLVMLTAFDIVLIETVGVGQREIDVSKLSDTTCFIAQPASGDSVQFLKAGIMEVPQVLVVNKADIGRLAKHTLADLRGTLKRQLENNDWTVPALLVSATQGLNIEALADILDQHRIWLVQKALLPVQRRRFQAEWILKRLREEFGRFGVEILGGESALFSTLITEEISNFNFYNRLRGDLLARWQGYTLNLSQNCKR